MALPVEKRKELYAAASRLRVNQANIKPQDIVTQRPLIMPLILDMAMGGSTNTVLHTLAVAHGRCQLFHATTNGLAKNPNICKVAPSSTYHIEDIHKAGGVHTFVGDRSGATFYFDLDCLNSDR